MQNDNRNPYITGPRYRCMHDTPAPRRSRFFHPEADGTPRCFPWRWLLWALLALLVVVLLSLGKAHGQEPPADPDVPKIKIAQEHRVANRTDHGICWFCSAEMLGKHLGIMPLHTLTERVVQTGVGLRGGATVEAVDHWVKTLGVKPRVNPHGRSQEGVRWLQAQLDAGLPVVVSYYDGRYKDGSRATHAVLLTHITRQKVAFGTGQDYSVHYVDPNGMKDQRYNWAWFWDAWTGRAYTFDPREQPPQFVQAPPMGDPRRPLVATHCVKKIVHPDVQARIQRYVNPPLEIRQQQVPGTPTHQLPYKTDQYVNAVFNVKLASNQDIKDGVMRPDDQFRFGCYTYHGHDYFSEYRQATGAKK